MTAAADRPEVAVVYGTRPEVIKMSPVVRALEERGGTFRVRRVFSGQHRELATDLFDALGMRPDATLDVMTEAQSLEDVGSRCLQRFGELFGEEPPDWILVQGDTATVFFASLAAYFHRVPVGHVEAGLRSHDKYAPFPEEMMRRMTGDLTEVHFAPTHRAAENLLAEGIDRSSVFVTGNTVVDAVRQAARHADEHVDPALREWVERHRRHVVVTLHRRESFEGDLEKIFEAIRSFAASHDVSFIYPVHPNPRVLEPAREILGHAAGVHLVEPLPYLDMVYLLSHCRAILTDSGGLQEEGPALGRRVLVARDVTERPEGVEAGVAELVGSDPEKIVAALERELTGSEVGTGIPTAETPYGDGRAGHRVADVLASRLTDQPRRTTDWRPASPVLAATA